MIEVKIIKGDEITKELTDELKEKGLAESIRDRCEQIEDIASALSYPGHRGIQELMADILIIAEEYEKESKEDKARLKRLIDKMGVSRWEANRHGIMTCIKCGYTANGRHRFCPGCGREMGR